MRALITLILCSLFLSGCDHSPEPLRIGSNRWLGYAPIYIADENKWTATANIHLVEYQTANGVTRGMHNGLLDAAFLTLDEAVLLQSTGHDIEIILVANLSAGADVLYATPDIRNLHDLKGKRVAVEGSTLGTYFLSHILDKAHLAIEDINIVNTPMYTHIDALREGIVRRGNLPHVCALRGGAALEGGAFERGRDRHRRHEGGAVCDCRQGRLLQDEV